MRLKDYGRNSKKCKVHVNQSGLLLVGIGVSLGRLQIAFFSVSNEHQEQGAKARNIDFHILNFTRPEGGGCIVIRRRPITR